MAISSNLEVMDTLCSNSSHHSLPRSTSSFELLNKYNPSFCRFTVEKLNKLITREIRDPLGGRELSTEDIMRVAAACFVGSHVEGEDDNLMDPSTLSSSGLTHDEIKKVDLAIHLLAAADNLINQQFDRASNLLAQCCEMCSRTGSPVERVVHYFSDALQERMRPSLKRPRTSSEDVTKAMPSNHAIELGIQTKQPFSQLVQFISVQTIIDHVACSKKIHIIDISIRHGLQCATLMQELATRSEFPVEQLKISAIGTCEAEIAATGKMLASFAKTLSLAFDFLAVIVTDLKDLKEEMFEVEEEETVCVYSSMDLGNMIIAGRDGLDNLMKVLRKLKPSVMTVAEVEAKLNSSCFTVRFTEALFYFSALSDYLDGFMNEHDDTRMAVESRFISQAIRNIIATEGSQRVVRHVGITVWRSFFARFGLMETKLNKWSMYQADLLVDRFEGGDSCTIDKNGESLILGWKGTPLVFVSAWEFL